MTGWRRAFRFRLRRSDVDREIEDELDFHIERTVARLVDEGMPRDEAEREARARFGDRDRHGRRVRRIARRRFRKHRFRERLDALARDVRIATRSLVRRPAFSVSTILVLGLGIAAATTVFSFARPVLLRPLPYPEPDRLVRIQETRAPEAPGTLEERNLIFPDIERIRERATRIAAVGGFLGSGGVAYSDETGARRIRIGSVDRHVFGVLGISPIRGRSFAEDDMAEGSEPVVVIGHRLWTERFGRDPEVLGRSIEVAYRPHRIIGVMPAGFDFPQGSEAWRPLVASSRFTNRFHVVQTVARLAPGATPATAEEEISTLVQSWIDPEPDLHGEATGATVRGWHAQLVAGVRPAMLVLGGAVGLLLLLVCVNVAGLLTARALEREREVALRRSLGASRGRLARGVLCESLLLAITGGVLGFLLSGASLGWVVSLSPADLPARDLVMVDGRIAGFAVLVTLLIGVGSGLVPAFRSGRVATPTGLKAGGTGTVRGGGSGLKGGVLIAAEVGMATLLVVGGGLLLHSFIRMLRVDTGIERLDVLTVAVDLPPDYDDASQSFAFLDRLRRGAEGLPGVSGTAISLFSPLRGSLPVHGVTLPGVEPDADDAENPIQVLSVTPGYFRLVGVPLTSGRAFLDSEGLEGPRVAIVSRTAARRLFGDRDPVGRTLQFGAAGSAYAGERRIVGVAGDVRQEGPFRSAPPLLYLPFEQYVGWGDGILLVGTTDVDPAAVVQPLRDLVHRLDPRIPIEDVETIGHSLSSSVAQPRFFTVLVVAFAALASLVALAGLYGILAYDVRRRFVELGIRAVLGASPRDNVVMLLRRGILWVSLGIAAGIVAAVPLTGWLESLMYGIEPHDPATIACAAFLMLAVGVGVALVPAAQATRADPGVAIRAD